MVEEKNRLIKVGVSTFFILFLILEVSLVLAYGDCNPGYVWSRGVIGCVQEKCPPGSGRLYSERCSCWTSEWGGTPKVTCSDPTTGLVTHCLPEKSECANNPSPYDPITGQCKPGFALNSDKTNCVTGDGTTSTPATPSPSPPENLPPTVSSPNPTSPKPSDTTPTPTTPTASETACNTKPNTQYDRTTEKCGCKENFLQDLRRSGCVTAENLQGQCEKIIDAIWDSETKQCSCIDSTLYASGFTNTCETAETFGTQVCGSRVRNAIYDSTQKKCVCPPNTKASDDKTACIKDSPFGRSCSDDTNCPGERNRCDLETGRCGCKPPYRASFDKDECVTVTEYGNQACPEKFPGSIFDEANKKCKCPDGWKKSDTGKECVEIIPSTSCDTDEKCPDDKKCNIKTKKCVEYPCECGEKTGHGCTAYECCIDTQCGDTQRCDNEFHACIAVECDRGVITNHICDPTGCISDSGCLAAEKCNRGKCEAIECTCGKIENHACTPYECCQTKPCTDVTKDCDQILHTCVTKEDVCKHFDTGTSSINLVFVPHGYTEADAATFRSKTQSVYNTIFNTEPFKSKKAKVKVHRVEKFDEDLGCAYFRAPGDPDDSTKYRGITCDHGKMMSLAGKCPVNFAFAVLNSDQYGGAAGGVGSFYGYMSKGTEPIGFVHELGHMLGLEDEYSKGATGEVAWATGVPNCDIAADCAKWKDLPGTECITGCAYSNWKRSSASGDLMMALANTQFGIVSTRHLNTKLR